MSIVQVRINQDITIPVLHDTEVHPVGDGYEREVLVQEWNPNDMFQVAKIEIRVDRKPEDSYAKISVWVSGSGGGWNQIAQIASTEFWVTVPGWQRWSSSKADTRTAYLTNILVQDLVALISERGMVL